MDENNNYSDVNIDDIQTEAPKPPKKSIASKIFLVLFGIIIIITIILLAIFLSDENNKKDDTDKTTISSSAKISTNKSPIYNEGSDGKVLSTVEIAQKVKPSIMGVTVYKSGTQYGEGSGIFMSTDGTYTYVLTCAHIINFSGITAKIQLEDGTEYDADIVGYDTRTDVGVLRVKQTGFTIAEFGDSTALQVGEPVYAIGNPGGSEFYGSFTSGVVSGIGRRTTTSDTGYTRECIQHDAAINPGNSGGALVNSFGQVIGINSSKIMNEEYEGMGFAVPMSIAKDVIDEILENGYVTNRPKLGITYTDISYNQTYETIAKANNIPDGAVIIVSIEADSSLYGTEAVKGDIIAQVNGKNITTTDILLNAISDGEVGDVITLTCYHVYNDYSLKKYEIKVKLVEDKGSSASTQESTSEFYNPFE